MRLKGRERLIRREKLRPKGRDVFHFSENSPVGAADGGLELSRWPVLPWLSNTTKGATGYFMWAAAARFRCCECDKAGGIVY